MSWLVAFNVINTRNEFVGRVVYFLKQVSEPILRPIRRIMPPLGGLDLSPLIAIIGIQFLQYCLFWFDINYLR
ncbi:MAG: YggT family protein [Alphaproteobacteria bacterium]|nr:YggT family protein [Alphaproteobacteria bacterium]